MVQVANLNPHWGAEKDIDRINRIIVGVNGVRPYGKFLGGQKMDNVVIGVEKSETCGEQCRTIPNPKSETTTESDRIAKHVVCKLTAFDKAISESKILEIDGLAIDGEPCAEVTQESKIKVLNNALQSAVEVSVDAIIRQPLNDLILALETGLFYRLHGVTRIVGYYSKIHNWNKSKIGELADRRKGNYWAGMRANTEKVGSLGE